MSHAPGSPDKGPTTDHYIEQAAELAKKAIVNESVEAYMKGWSAAWNMARYAERKFILRLAKAAAMENEIGEYVYLKDLDDYIRTEDEATSKPAH